MEQVLVELLVPILHAPVVGFHIHALSMASPWAAHTYHPFTLGLAADLLWLRGCE